MVQFMTTALAGKSASSTRKDGTPRRQRIAPRPKRIQTIGCSSSGERNAFASAGTPAHMIAMMHATNPLFGPSESQMATDAATPRSVHDSSAPHVRCPRKRRRSVTIPEPMVNTSVRYGEPSAPSVVPSAMLSSVVHNPHDAVDCLIRPFQIP